MKKILSLFLILTFLVALPITPLNALAKTSKFERPVYGDANHDRTIDLHDVVHIQRFVAKLNDTLFCEVCADVYDRDVDMTDVVHIQKYIAHIKTDSRCGEDTEYSARLEPLPIDKETQKRIEDAYLKTRTDINEVKLAQIFERYDKATSVKYYGTLSEGSMLVCVNLITERFLLAPCTIELNEYAYYFSNPGAETKLLTQKGELKSIKEAINEKIISNEVFNEIAYHLHMEKIK